MAITAIKPRANAAKTMNNFWWADMQSTDVKSSVEFYSRVLGWEFREEKDDEGTVVYNTALIGGLKIAGLGEMMGEAKKSGMPSMWTDYVSVTDAEAVCAKAEQLGGKVMMPAMEVMGEGTMAIILDTTGAAFGIWQPGNHDGADAVNQPFTLTWTELFSSDINKSVDFYTKLFGWTSSESPEAKANGMEYHMLELDGAPIAGMMPKPKEMAQAPDCWITYMGVADVEATKAEVTAAGGTVMWGPMQTGPGKSIGVKDPQGAIIHLMQLDEWPA